MRVRRGLLYPLSVGLLAMAMATTYGCGGGGGGGGQSLLEPSGPPAPIAKFAYVVNNASNSVSAYSIDATTGAASAFASTEKSGIEWNWNQRIGAVTTLQASEIPITDATGRGTG